MPSLDGGGTGIGAMSRILGEGGSAGKVGGGEGSMPPLIEVISSSPALGTSGSDGQTNIHQLEAVVGDVSCAKTNPTDAAGTAAAAASPPPPGSAAAHGHDQKGPHQSEHGVPEDDIDWELEQHLPTAEDTDTVRISGEAGGVGYGFDSKYVRGDG